MKSIALILQVERDAAALIGQEIPEVKVGVTSEKLTEIRNSHWGAHRGALLLSSAPTHLVLIYI
jgi:hypothetical protein